MHGTPPISWKMFLSDTVRLLTLTLTGSLNTAAAGYVGTMQWCVGRPKSTEDLKLTTGSCYNTEQVPALQTYK